MGWDSTLFVHLKVYLDPSHVEPLLFSTIENRPPNTVTLLIPDSKFVRHDIDFASRYVQEQLVAQAIN